MKILFLSSRIPFPPDRGDKVRTLYFLRQFVSLGEVSLASLVNPAQDQAAIKQMKSEIPHTIFVKHSKFRALWNMLKNLFTKLPFQTAFYHNPALHKELKQLSQEQDFDIVYCHLIRMVPYARYFKPQSVILDYTDCISLEYKRSLQHLGFARRIFFNMESKRTAAYELSVANLFAENWVISPVDLSQMGLNSHQRSVILPNQVFIPAQTCDPKYKGRLIFTGNMSVPHNVVAAQNIANKIMPALLRKYPQLELYLVGANPSAEIKALDGVNNTRVLGFVKDLYGELCEADIFVAPMYFSAGIQNKALEAMACALPVITTSNVAKSLDAHDEVELMVADDNSEFVTKTMQLIESEETRDQIGRAGRSLVHSKYSQDAISKLFNMRVQGVLDASKGNKS